MTAKILREKYCKEFCKNIENIAKKKWENNKSQGAPPAAAPDTIFSRTIECLSTFPTFPSHHLPPPTNPSLHNPPPTFPSHHLPADTSDRKCLPRSRLAQLAGRPHKLT